MSYKSSHNRHRHHFFTWNLWMTQNLYFRRSKEKSKTDLLVNGVGQIIKLVSGETLGEITDGPKRSHGHVNSSPCMFVNGADLLNQSGNTRWKEEGMRKEGGDWHRPWRQNDLWELLTPHNGRKISQCHHFPPQPGQELGQTDSQTDRWAPKGFKLR